MAAAKARRLAPLRFPPRPPTTRPSLQSVCKAGERRGRKETFNNDLAAKGERKEVGARRRRRDVGRGREGNERMGEATWEDFSSPLFFSPLPLSFPHPSPPFSLPPHSNLLLRLPPSLPPPFVLLPTYKEEEEEEGRGLVPFHSVASGGFPSSFPLLSFFFSSAPLLQLRPLRLDLPFLSFSLPFFPRQMPFNPDDHNLPPLNRPFSLHQIRRWRRRERGSPGILAQKSYSPFTPRYTHVAAGGKAD